MFLPVIYSESRNSSYKERTKLKKNLLLAIQKVL